jgi:hypothetical protein
MSCGTCIRFTYCSIATVMKLAIALATWLTASAAYADAPHADAPHTVLSTDVVDLVQEIFGVGIDHQVGPHFALHGTVSYDNRTYYDSAMGWDYHGDYRVAAGVRVSYANPYNGPFVDAELQLRWFSTHEVCNYEYGDRDFIYCDDDWRAWSPRLSVGWQATLFSKLSVAAAVGAGIEETLRTDGRASFESTVYVGSVRVGYAF